MYAPQNEIHKSSMLSRELFANEANGEMMKLRIS